jgi:YspA, cpYpsA-related SLOG family
MHVRDETWLICGGRDFADAEGMALVMTRIIAIKAGWPSRLVHGAARGADLLAADWAKHSGIEEIAMPADWEREGKVAGFLRNQRMLDEAKPILVIAFPGGNGTRDMIRRSKAAGVEVIEIDRRQMLAMKAST